RLMAALVDGFCESYRRAPSSITLDIDDTCDTVHGHQQLSLFNAHYDERCFLPIHIYDAASGKPVAMILREGKTPSGEEVRTILKHIIKRIRRHWHKVNILVRGDSHYGRDEAAATGQEVHHVVASLKAGARHLYETLYCARGNAENFIKAHKSQLASRPHLLPRSQSQPVPLDPAHRRLLALAGNARRRSKALAAIDCRVRNDPPSADQDRCARRGGGRPHPCLSAHGMPRSRCLPRARRSALRRR